MNKYILSLVVITLLTGLIGFNFEFNGATAVRIAFLLAADILVILLFGKLLFWTQKTRKTRKLKRQEQVSLS